jgi:catechol 2,3-dioxygenase-like lactoylglutathione lyase family enzyme
MAFQVSSFNHLVLTVRSIERTCDFYRRGLGMEVRTFGEGRTALHFGTCKFNLHEVGHEIDPKAAYPTPGSADFCLLTDTPLTEVVAHLQRENLPIELSPVRRDGATGPILSVYLRDPDQNLVEISNQL